MQPNQYRIVFLDGAWIDFKPGEGFNFIQFILSCRAAGYLLNESSYIRWDLVRCVLSWTDGNPPLVPVPGQNAPTSETKQ